MQDQNCKKDSFGAAHPAKQHEPMLQATQQADFMPLRECPQLACSISDITLSRGWIAIERRRMYGVVLAIVIMPKNAALKPKKGCCQTCTSRRPLTILGLYMVMPAGMPPGPRPPGAVAAPAPADLGCFFSTITACVVNMMPAIPQAFIRALLVTCASNTNQLIASSAFAHVHCSQAGQQGVCKLLVADQSDCSHSLVNAHSTRAQEDLQ